MTSGRSVTLRISRMAELVSCLARWENAHTGSKGLSMEGLLAKERKKVRTLSHNAMPAPPGDSRPLKSVGSKLACTVTFHVYRHRAARRRQATLLRRVGVTGAGLARRRNRPHRQRCKLGRAGLPRPARCQLGGLLFLRWARTGAGPFP